jgi:antitoxin component of MazEF toxin-antitoxin module
MKTRVQRWGNGLALRIPKSLAVKVGLLEGASVDLSFWQGKVVIRPVPRAADPRQVVAGCDGREPPRRVAHGAGRR